MSMECRDAELSSIAMEVFGTEDYKMILSILPPYDGMVRDFNKKIERLKIRKGGQ